MPVQIMECPHCPAIFGSEETLSKHVAAIHEKLASRASSPLPAAASATDTPGSSDGDNLDLTPLLGVLTHEQKDMLLLRAIAADDSLAYHVLAAVLKPLSAEAAAARLEELEPTALAATVRAYVDAGAGRNALMMLRVVTAAASDALGGLGSLLQSDGWEESEELEAVERLPRADAIGALWGEALAGGDEPGGDRSSARDHASDEDESLLSQLAAAIGPVRGAQPGLLVSADGNGVPAAESVAAAQAALAAALEARASGAPAPPASKKARRG